MWSFIVLEKQPHWKKNKVYCLSLMMLQTLWKFFMKMMNYSRMCPWAKEYKSVTTDSVKRKKQKRLLLVNIKELYLEFWKKYINNSQENDNRKIHIRCLNFFSLRPKWVVTASDSCMNVCAIHQNVELMMHAIPSNDTYKNLLEKLVCDISSCACMMKQYEKCNRIIKL